MSASHVRLARLLLNDPARARIEAERIDQAERARTARRKAKPAHEAVKRAKGRKAATKESTAEETAELRRQAMERADGRCELCGLLFTEGALYWRSEMAHLDGGSGKKHEDQWIGNVLMAHHLCHQGRLGLDKEPLRWLPEVKTWAARHGYPVPRRFVKLEALRAAHPEREKETTP